MKDFFDNLRFDHPIVFRLSVSVLTIAIFLIVFFSLPPTPLFRALGITSVQTRGAALYYALFWDFRASTHAPDRDDAVVKTGYGNMVGLDQTGSLISKVAEGAKFDEEKMLVADTKITDLYGAAALIGSLKAEDAKFDYYSRDQVVIWIRGVPFNVKLIEAGYAMPDPNPPTNIVDKAFAAYYWRIFHGNEN